MKHFIILFALVSCSTPQKKEISSLPQHSFTITEGVKHPESALYSATHQAIFVSNIVSGNPVETKPVGNISMYDPTGKVIASPWVKGLKAPKGMAIVGHYLYVSDVDLVAKIDIDQAKIVKTYPIKGAKFLNDVIADKAGNVYISDMFTNTIHVLDAAGMRVWKKTQALRSPNGLFTDGKEHILMVSWGDPIDKNFNTKNLGALSSHSIKNSQEPFTEETSLRGNLDGIDSDAQGNLWVSDWISGDIYKVSKDGKSEKLLNLGQGSADISVAKELNLLLVPQMSKSRVEVYKLK